MIPKAHLDVGLPWRRHSNLLLRLAGQHATAGEVQEQMGTQTDLPIRVHSMPDNAEDDYAQIEPALPMSSDEPEPPTPVPGVGYAGLTAEQRVVFHDWLLDPVQPTAPAYQRLYLAQLEVGLLDPKADRNAIQEEILRLLAADAWQESDDLTRVGLLAGWLAQDGTFLASALSRRVTTDVLGVGLGWQALLGAPLTASELWIIRQAWVSPFQEDEEPLDPELLQLNLDSLAATLGEDPLQHALSALLTSQPQVEEPAETPPLDRSPDADDENDSQPHPWKPWQGEWLPWRTVHRQLRLALPQPNLRPHLEPMLAALFHDAATVHPQPRAPEPDRMQRSTENEPDAPNWYLVLEFGESRSQYYDYVVHQARKQSGYQMLMDETRQIVHRILFRKGQMRYFWRLWDYVQNWSSTKVYRNGEELAKWKIWPYSQYLR